MIIFLKLIFTLLFTISLYTSTPIIADDLIQTNQISLVEEKTPVKVEIIKEHETIATGDSFSLLLHFDIDENWHTYWKNPGDLGMAASIDWTLPEGFIIDEVHWPTPLRFTSDSVVGIGYEKEMSLLVNMRAPENIKNETATIAASISWLACSDEMCLPGQSDTSTNLLIKDEKSNALFADRFEKVRQNLPKNNWNIEAESESDDLIHLKVKAPENHSTTFTKAYFFPEETGFIDHKEITHFASETNELQADDFHYQIKLKRQDPQKFQHLKGILILLNENGNEVVKESLAVDIALKTKPIDSDNDIAFVSKAEIEKQILQPSSNEHPHSEFEGHFEMALLFAFAGGMLLNLMPCVLPVLSLKIFSFVKLSGENRRLCFQHGLSFSLGVLVSFWVLAGALLILQAYGQAVGWGFQLQEPIFVAMLASVIFIIGLNLFGVMELGTSVTSAAGNINHKGKGLTSSFLSGVLATAVATPCTGPFLGSAVGYAVTLPSTLALLIFTMLGAGMAFPYLLLSAYPSLLRFIPKPGNWMITFKEIMGFLMMATTIWLLFVFAAQTSSLSLIFLLGSFFLFGISCWIYGKFATPMQKKKTRIIGTILSLIFLTLGTIVIFKATDVAADEEITKQETVSGWEPFSPQRIVELQAQGIPVFVDFTAKWCLICQTNHMSLASTSAEEKFKQMGVVKMKADWTKKDPIITEELAKFGRNSVPLYILYGKNGNEAPKVLPQVLTSDVVIDYLNGL